MTGSRLLNPVFDSRPQSTAIEACRSCGSVHLHPFLDLGEPPLAGRLLFDVTECRAEPRVPLVAVLCRDCTLVQITETVRPELLYTDNYPCFSSFSPGFVERARTHVAARLAERRLDRASLVVEIGSNDGALLAHYADAGVTVLGIDPAEGPMRAARARRVDTIEAFFTAELAQEIAQRRGLADIVHLGDVLGRMDDANDAVAGIAMLMKPDGCAVIELPCLRAIIEGVGFDGFIHERLCHYSLTVLDTLLRRHGLYANRIEDTGADDGLLRVIAEKREEVGDEVYAMLAEERALGMGSPEFYENFADEVALACEKIAAMIRELRAQGKSVAAYGAAARGSALLEATGLGVRDIAFVADRNTHKQGCMMPGAHVPIVPAETLFERRPDFALLLAWTQHEQILAQEAAFMEAGGAFIVPLPEPRIIRAGAARESGVPRGIC